MPARVLIVDDDRAVRSALKVNLSKQNYEVEVATQVSEALLMLAEKHYDLVLTDVKMPGASGMELLKQVKLKWPDISVIMMTGFGSVEDAVMAIKEGAAEYVIKPISKEPLLVMVERAVKARKMQDQLRELQERVEERFGFGKLIGNNARMRSIYDLARHVADTSATVLLQGPTGTGKELMAHAIHYNSQRKNAPFIRVNCAALPETLLESELFGHEKGSFSGAIRQHRGRFELADGGTILLDEIGEITHAMQVKLLRVLEEGELQRLGGTDTLKVDVRIIAATNRNLSKEVEEGRFRQDLFYRLNVFTIQLPSLKERKDDLVPLAEHFMKKYSEKNKKKVVKLLPAAIDQLMAYDWPGNVRELEHVIEKAVILAKGKEIEQVDLPAARTRSEAGPQRTLAQALHDCEYNTIVQALRAADGVQARAAEALDISRSNLNYRLNKLNIKVPEVMSRPA